MSLEHSPSRDESGSGIPSLAEILRDQPLYLDEAIDVTEAARVTGIPIATVYTMRTRGGGIVFSKRGSRLSTTRRRCLEYLANLVQSNSTSDTNPEANAA